MIHFPHHRSAILSAVLIGMIAAAGRGESKPFRIQVVDDETGRGVPLVELKTVNNIRLLTDSNGIIAFDEPGLMDQPVFFYVESHGYLFPKDGFGFRGAALEVKAGGSATLKIKRLNLAERLYRVTGAGIYRDSLLTGDKAPIRESVINGRVLGSDSVVNAVFRGKLHWFWGDTNRPGYPLGNFDVPGATSELPSQGGLDPAKGIDLSYFVDETGFAKPTAKLPGDGPTWIDGLVVLGGHEGRERMFAAFVKVKPPLEVYRRGLAEYDDELKSFSQVAEFDMKAPCFPGGHPFVIRDDDAEYVYFSRPYPLVRVPADVRSISDLSQYEAFTCLKTGSRLDAPQIDRDGEGAIRYGWKRDAPAVGPAEQAALIASKHMAPHEALLQLCDRDGGKPVFAHGGSVYWNEFRRRWVMIAVERGGTSNLGEVWYAEADTPLGPWAYAVKVATHNRYSFYNPKQHPMFDRNGGRTIFFEGTYTNTFSGNAEQTPRYDYNQVMYRLQLDDARLALPVAIYRVEKNRHDRFATRQAARADESAGAPDLRSVAFFALDRPGSGSVGIYASKTAAGHPCLKVAAEGIPRGENPVFQFHALAAELATPPANTLPLFGYIDADGDRRAYSTDASLNLRGFEREEKPLCRVWRNPWLKLAP